MLPPPTSTSRVPTPFSAVTVERTANYLHPASMTRTDAGTPADAVEEELAVARFAHRARRDRSDATDFIRLGNVSEAFERHERRFGGLRPDGAA